MHNDTNKIYTLFTAGHRVETDSRKVSPGAIFFALRGGNFDGNAYAAGALEAGAAAAVVDDPKVVRDERYILVPDVLKALQELARRYRREAGIPVLAITGSNGKTTTKELVVRVLSARFRVSATVGNLNNHIGVPLTLLAIPPDTEVAVVEMGANHRGEIRDLCRVAEPDYGLITNIGRAHLEGFGGEEGVRKGKGELFDYLQDTDGIAFYPEDSEALSEMAEERPGLQTIGYSAEELEVLPSENGLLTLRYGSRTIRTRLTGAYNRANAAAALAVGDYFEVDRAEAIAAIESYTPDNMRSQRVVTGRNILYLDAYNANPSSMVAALENFSQADEPGYRKVLILGEMRELGEYSEQEHRAIVERIERLRFGEVYLVGKEFASTGESFRTFAESEELGLFLKEHPLRKSAILIKGSRGVKLEELVSEL